MNMSDKQENDDNDIYKCGKQILKSAHGAIATHKDSDQCQKDFVAKKKKENDKQKQPLLFSLWNNKKQTPKKLSKPPETQGKYVKFGIDKNRDP